MPKGRWSEVLWTASQQLGLLTRSQLVASGMTPQAVDHRLRVGHLIRVHPGVYRVAGAPEGWRQSLLAALLAAGQPSFISHRAAGVLWGLEEVTAHRPDVLLPHPRRIELADVTIHRTRVLRPDDVTIRGGIRMTSAARTLIDLAGVLPRAVLERALDDARRRKIVTLDQVRSGLDARGPNGVKGWGRIDRLVQQRLGTRPTGSGKETTFLRGLRRQKLPLPVAQYVVFDDDGRFVARPDFAYPDIKLAIEIDGAHHRDPTQWEADLARQNRLVLAGWRFLRFPRTDRQGQRDAFSTIRSAFAAFGEPDPNRSWPELLKRGLRS